MIMITLHIQYIPPNRYSDVKTRRATEGPEAAPLQRIAFRLPGNKDQRRHLEAAPVLS